MTRLARTILPFALLLSPACAGMDVGRSHQEITGGAPEAGYPAVFSLAYDGQGGCTGTCITSDVGLTAAHCVEGEMAGSLSALFGDDEMQPQMTLPVAEIASEPGGADIALLRFSGACPARIPYNPIPLEAHVGEPAVMVGFGVTAENAYDAGVKRSGVAALFSVTPAEVNGMETGELATSNDPAGTCYGDSGGPTFMTFDGVEYVVGVTSRGSLDESGQEEPCAQGRSIAVRADSYKGFIDAFLDGSDPGDGGSDLPPDGSGDDPSGDGDPTPDPDPNPDPGQGGNGGGASAGCQAAGQTAGGLCPLLLLLALAWLRRRTPRIG